MKVVTHNNHAPIKMWVDEVPNVEPQAEAQLKNIASMPFIFKHVAVMPDVHLGKGATVGSVIATRQAIIPAAVGVDIGCFRGDMKVPLLDGTQATFEDLEQRDEPFWVYSINEAGSVAPGLAKCVKTRANAELVRVVVSGGDEIICTPDHEFMLKDGTYRQAKELKFNDSLMPLYRRWQTRDGYESVSNGKGSSKMTHVMVWESANGEVPDGHVVHHKNHIHFDNSPNNLELMTISEHSAHHRAVGHTFDNDNPAFQRLRREGIARRKDDPKKLEQMIQVGTDNITRYMNENPEHFAESVKGNGKRGAPYLHKFNTSPRACDDCGSLEKNPSSLRWHKQKEHGYNHKVLTVQPLNERADVYCLQVDKHHNFALAAGVFVHNCGMMAVRTSLKATDLPDSLSAVRSDIERAVPHGFVTTPGSAVKGGWENVPVSAAQRWLSLELRYQRLVERHPKIDHQRSPAMQLGSLGGGNHFIELCLDLEDRVWVMLHSGSRGVGNRIGSYFIACAKEEMARHFIHLPDSDLAYLVEGSELFNDYCDAVEWAQEYAYENRKEMMASVLDVLHRHLPSFGLEEHAVNCHHNYVSWETHYGQECIVTRKGAVRARNGELGIIPGSMGTRSFIVRGLGNPESFNSCSHGAGRVMSRTRARKEISVAEHIEATKNVECRKDKSVIDESPRAYKNIEDVMASQTDLVSIEHELRQVLCVKG